MRQAALYAEIRPRWTAEDRQLFKEAVSMSNDLHLLVKVAVKKGHTVNEEEFSRFRDFFDELLKKMSHDQ